MPDFLLEIGCEEIPAGYIAPALSGLADSFAKALAAEGLEARSVKTTATPRRFILFAEGLPEATEKRVEKKTGPSSRARRTRTFSLPRLRWASPKSQGFPVAKIDFPISEQTRNFFVFHLGELSALSDAERKVLLKADPPATIRKDIAPKKTADVLAAALPGLVRAMPFPKSMYWRTWRCASRGR